MSEKTTPDTTVATPGPSRKKVIAATATNVTVTILLSIAANLVIDKVATKVQQTIVPLNDN